MILAKRLAEITEVVIESNVLMTALNYYDANSPTAALKDGQ
jgi:hypothetical protein